MNSGELQAVARAIVAAQKGILAADESVPTMTKRFASVNVESTEENRQRYRELLFTTEGIESTIGGVILHDETLRQAARDGTPFARVLSRRGIHPGIKVDQGYGPLPLYPGENITEGLDQLRQRLEEYKQLGAKFAKWRAVIAIDRHALPSTYGITANAHALARYAALCQQLGMVPIVEPEVLMDGAHDIARCEAVTSRVLREVFSQLCAHRVLFEGMLLKPNHRSPQRNEPGRPASVGSELFVWTRTAGAGAGRLAGTGKQRCGSANSVRQAVQAKWNGARGEICAGDGAAGLTPPGSPVAPRFTLPAPSASL